MNPLFLRSPAKGLPARWPTLFVAAALVWGSFSAPAAAEGDTGLKAGVQAPVFQLPLVNTFSAELTPGKGVTPVTKWGPDYWTGPARAGKKKLVILSFFATYCEPCKKEMPELVRLYDTYKDQGLGVMLVSIDKGNEQRDAVIALAQQNNVSFPVTHDRFQVVARRYSAERLPYMLMLDGSGTIKVVHTGYTEELKSTLENEVRGHLGLAALPPPAVAPGEATATDDGKGPAKGKADKKKPKAKGADKGADKSAQVVPAAGGAR